METIKKLLQALICWIQARTRLVDAKRVQVANGTAANIMGSIYYPTIRCVLLNVIKNYSQAVGLIYNADIQMPDAPYVLQVNKNTFRFGFQAVRTSNSGDAQVIKRSLTSYLMQYFYSYVTDVKFNKAIITIIDRKVTVWIEVRT